MTLSCLSLPCHADFAAVQWWGSLGGFHGLAPTPAGGLLGPTIEGQHSEGWLNHFANLDTVLDADLARRWQSIADTLQLPSARLPAADGRTTRGAWVRAVFRLHH